MAASNSLNITETGFQSFDGIHTFKGRTLTAGTGITITNGTGVSGDPVITSTASLTDLHDSRFIVSGTDLTHGANYSTIASAITAAVALGGNQTIFVQPGTYTENLTLADGITIASFGNLYTNFSALSVVIKGKSTITSGTATFDNISFLNNADYILDISGGGIVNYYNSFFQINSHAAILGVTNSFVNFINCFGRDNSTNSNVFSSTDLTVVMINSSFLSSTSIASTFAGAGSFTLQNSTFQNHITTSGTAQFLIKNSTLGLSSLNHTFTINSTGSSLIYNSIIYGGSQPAVSIGVGATIVLSDCTIESSNTNAITGAGTLNYGNITFTGTSSLINTTTQVPLVQSNDAVKITTPGAYPYTTIPQDAVILVDTSVARTITPLASPTTGQKHIIKDSVGSATANNITITPSGKNIDGVASYILNTNYGSITIVYNGTEWNTI